MTDRTRYGLLIIFFMVISFVRCNNGNKEAQTVHGDHKQPVYTCPMHPEIIKNSPGVCPICGMDLVKKEADAQYAESFELDNLLKPTNEFVISTIPVTTIRSREENIELDVLGNVVYDTRQIGVISSRVSGRIEKLYIKYKYQKIKKGQKVMDIYSPELSTAQQNLLFLIKNDPENTSLITAAKDRLELLGLSRQQINQIEATKKMMMLVPVYSSYTGFATNISTGNMPEKEINNMASTTQELNVKQGMYLQKGQGVLSVYNSDKAWILLNFYPEQQGLIKVGTPVHVIPEAFAHPGLRAQIDYIEPLFREGNKTLTARVYFNNQNMRLPIGSRVKAKVFVPTKNAEWLPREAVLAIGRRQIVFVKEAGGFRTRQIYTGLQLDKFIEVRKGLSATDSVATNAHYLVDNEAFIKIK